MGEVQPRMRAGDKDRQQVVEQLGKHLGEGRLTVDEFDDRVVRAHASTYLDQLPGLTADLPSEPAAQLRPARSPRGAPPGLLVLLAALLAWQMVAAVVYGAPPFLLLLLVFLLLRHRRLSRRW